MPSTKPILGVLTLDHEAVGKVIVLREGGAEYTLAYVSVQVRLDDADAQGAAVRAAADRLWAAHSKSLIALTADPLLIIYCEDAVRSAARGLLVLPSPLMLSPLAVQTLGPEQQVLVLIDVSGIDDLEEMTPRLLHYGMGLQESESWRVVVEAVQGCCVVGSDHEHVGKSVLERVKQVQEEPDVDIRAVVIESPQLLLFAPALRRALGVPVYDTLSVLRCCEGAARGGAPAAEPEAGPSREGAAPAGPPDDADGLPPREREPSAALRRVLAGEPPPNPWAELIAHSTCVVVAAGDLLRVPFFVAQPSCLEYTFDTQAGGDVGFSVLGGEAGAAEAMHAADGASLLRKRGGGAQSAESGELELPPGWARVEFDNSSSWVRSRTLGYSLVCTPLEQKRRRDGAVAALLDAVARHRAAEAAAAAQREQLSAIGAREAEARRAHGASETRLRALRELRAEFGAVDGASQLEGAAERALSAAAATLRAVAEERDAAEARFEAGRAEREALLQGLEAMLEEMQTGGEK